MNHEKSLPRILVIDDVLGRTHADRRNEERVSLCGDLGLVDVTGDSWGVREAIELSRPTAEAVFFRGQRPATSIVGDTVENDMAGTVEMVGRGWEARPPGHPRWSLVLLDLCFYTGPVTVVSDRRFRGMPVGVQGEDQPTGYFGLRVLDKLHDTFPDLPIVILSAQDKDAVSLEYTKRGALGFLARGGSASEDELKKLLWRDGLFADETGLIVGRSRALLLALRSARRSARAPTEATNGNILLRGERGTGKELFARYVNQAASGRPRKLVVVDAGAITPSLWTSELFGIEDKTATGVVKREGKIVQADGGDLFLDEIGDMPVEVQTGLRRVLDDGVVPEVGGRGEGRRVDLRCLSATNVDIELRVGTGAFKEDLLDRLRKAGTIFLPPLSDRLEDLPLLVESFVRDAERNDPAARKRQIDPEALEFLALQEWPDNVRGLRNCVRKAVIDHSNLEHLVAEHVRRAREAMLGPRQPLSTRTRAVPSAPPPPTITDFKDLVKRFDSFSFEKMEPELLRGALPHVESVCARLMARYVRSVLWATRKVTASSPEGEISISRAMNFARSGDTLTTSNAADLIKRLLGISPLPVDEVLADDVLRQALETARRLRPTQRRMKKDIPSPRKGSNHPNTR
jgi:DNA-binding NtrC family response regulator